MNSIIINGNKNHRRHRVTSYKKYNLHKVASRNIGEKQDLKFYDKTGLEGEKNKGLWITPNCN